MHLPEDPIHAGAAVAGVCVFLLLAWRLLRRGPRYPYQVREGLLSAGERAFSRVLDQAVGGDFRICPKVRMADVIAVRPGLSGKHYYRHFGRISSKHFDFVLCDPATFEVVAAIELDDRSHRESSRAERDAFVDAALAAAGVPILHVPAMRAYSVRKLREQVLDLLETGGAIVAERH